ncbi:MAG TPA: NlpC/P60 family protein [Sphingorhabdus sp.]|nr:NlpC/P60 family protein [Sphingorhabdus sp.]
MPHDVGRAISARALACVGVPFRLRGRQRDAGLDCVGLVANALAGAGVSFEVSCDYTLRGDYLTRISTFFDRDCFDAINGPDLRRGDILLCESAVRQLHFAVVAGDGAVHAYAGLRRIVLTPLPLPWPIIGHWRYIGD